MNIGFGTVFFPQNIRFLEDFLGSLASQTFKNFDLVIVNDGISNIEDILEKNYKSKYIILDPGANPQSNRFNLLEYLSTNYEYIILGDSDDMFMPNRIEISIEYLQYNSILVNELIPFQTKNKFSIDGILSKRFRNDQLIKLNDILNKNIFGLSNTAFKQTSLENIFKQINFHTDIFDWHFYLNLLKEADAVFTDKTATMYRIHDNNTAGLKNNTKNISVQNEIIKNFIIPNKLYDKYVFKVYSSTSNKNKLWWE